MNAIKKIASLALAAMLGISSLPALAESAPVQPELVARVKEIIEADGYQFKDLNDNGELDPYEDWRLPAEERAENLLSMMDASQKAAQMVHLTLVTKKDSWFSKNNVGFALVYEYALPHGTESTALRCESRRDRSQHYPMSIQEVHRHACQ